MNTSATIAFTRFFLSHCIKYLFLGVLICQSLESYSQATFKFDQLTKSVDTEGSIWKVGENLEVIIENFDCTDRKYIITYKGDEKINEEGLTFFRQVAGDRLTSVEMTDKGIINCNPHRQLLIPIERKDYSLVTVEEFDNTGNLTDKQIYTFKNHGGLKFDVSTGFFVSGLMDDVYVLQTQSDSTNKIIKENVGKFRVGIGVLVHLHTRWKGTLNAGVSGGFEVDNQSKVGYLGGLSVFLGEDRKFVLSGGVVLGKRKTISNAYKVDQIVDSSITVIPTVDIWAHSSFGSLTYNF